MLKPITIIAAAGVVAISLIGNESPCAGKQGCREISVAEYKAIKNHLADSAEDGVVTYDEYGMIVAVIDFEAKTQGSINLGKIKSNDDLRKNLIKKLRE